MRHATLVELAARARVHLPEALAGDWPPRLRGGRRARLVPVPAAVRHRPVGAAHRGRRAPAAARDRARTSAADGSGWLEIQVDPSGYADRFGGLTAHRRAGARRGGAAAAPRPGVGIGVIVAANRTKHPLEARTLARLAAQLRRPRGDRVRAEQRRAARRAPPSSPPAFRIARAGRAAVGPARRRAAAARPASGPAWTTLHADRIGHGVAAAEDPRADRRLAAGRITLEVCPSSNVALGVAATPADVPLRALLDAGVPVALGADDPLLFGPGSPPSTSWPGSAHGLTDGRAGRAGPDVGARLAPRPTRSGARLLAGIDAWLGTASTGRGTGPAAARAAPGRQSETPTSTGSCDQLDRRTPPARRRGSPGQREQVRGAARRRGWSAPACAWPRCARRGRCRSPCRSRPARSATRRHLRPGRRRPGSAGTCGPGRSARRRAAAARRARPAEHRVGEERARAAGVRVGGVEHHALAAAQPQHGRADLGQRRRARPAARRARGPARRTLIGRGRGSPGRSWKRDARGRRSRSGLARLNRLVR